MQQLSNKITKQIHRNKLEQDKTRTLSQLIMFANSDNT